jgi:hypothetical protein
VYGPRETDKFKNILSLIDIRILERDPTPLRETHTISPFSNESDPLPFPFLIMEAKSGKDEIPVRERCQTAFCIRRLLTLQYDLRTITGQRSPWQSGPLVWFLRWDGERWSVAAVYVRGRDSSQECVSSWKSKHDHSLNNPSISETDALQHPKPIVDLWSGDINGEDGAL